MAETNPRATTRARHRTLVLFNPDSGRLRRDADAVRRLRSLPSPAEPYAVDGPEATARALEVAAPRPDDTLCIAGGDGTLHMVLTALNTRLPHGNWPRMMLLPAGSTNLAAFDLGLTGGLRPWLDALERYVGGVAPAGEGVRRAVLRIDVGGESELCGLFFGAALVAAGASYFQANVRGRAPTKQGFALLPVARFVVDFALHGADTEGVQALEASIDGGPWSSHRAVMCTATSLERLLVGMKLRWTDEEGPMRWTVVEADARRFWWRLWRLILSRPGGVLVPEEGYVQRAGTEVRLAMDGAFALDGEAYRARRAKPITIRADRVTTWIVPA